MHGKIPSKNNPSITLENGQQGSCIVIETSQSIAKVSLFGGQVLSFVSKNDGRERLWLSETAVYDGKTPIRGGIPLCWPWFSAHLTNKNFPNHGFARTQKWTLTDFSETFDNSTSNLLTLNSNKRQLANSVSLTLRPSSLGLYDYAKELNASLTIELGETLKISLTTHNDTQSAVEVSKALHTYFNIPDVNDVVIGGISTHYFDKTTSNGQYICPSPYQIMQEVDRIHTFHHNYYSQQQAIDLRSLKTNKSFQFISMQGHDSVVVWNPWKTLSKTLNDMPDTAYLSMLCIEAANTQNMIVGPKETHTLTQTIC